MKTLYYIDKFRKETELHSFEEDFRSVKILAYIRKEAESRGFEVRCIQFHQLSTGSVIYDFGDHSEFFILKDI